MNVRKKYNQHERAIAPVWASNMIGTVIGLRIEISVLEIDKLVVARAYKAIRRRGYVIESLSEYFY